jgi:hypothetical protein
MTRRLISGSSLKTETELKVTQHAQDQEEEISVQVQAQHHWARLRSCGIKYIHMVPDNGSN